MYLQWQPWINKIRQLVTDREAWHAAIHGVAESDTTEWLNWTELNPNYLGNTNKWMKRPILHLFNCQCSCFLNMSIQRSVIAGVLNILENSDIWNCLFSMDIIVFQQSFKTSNINGVSDTVLGARITETKWNQFRITPPSFDERNKPLTHWSDAHSTPFSQREPSVYCSGQQQTGQTKLLPSWNLQSHAEGDKSENRKWKLLSLSLTLWDSV